LSQRFPVKLSQSQAQEFKAKINKEVLPKVLKQLQAALLNENVRLVGHLDEGGLDRFSNLDLPLKKEEVKVTDNLDPTKISPEVEEKEV